MRTIGILGGMSWQSSADYYRHINAGVVERLGGYHSARTLMLSVDFAEIEALQAADDWDGAGQLLAEDARALEAGGAGAIILATNTMHRVAEAIEAAVSIPLLHIADPTGDAIRSAGLSRVALLGTRYTMEHEFYRGRLGERFGLEALVPDEPDRSLVHEVIYDELVHGVVRDESREAYRGVVSRLVARGAEGVILGCTEIGLLLSTADVPIPVFDTTRLHCEAAVDWLLADGPREG